tara:strand:- start:414 stop:1433 length:1020 start_codon:yes stop_codon:yes gene_type:complete
MGYNLAVLGATGAVGHEIITILEERNFPIENIYALASKRSVGKEVSFGDKVLKVENVENFDFSSVDIAIFSAGSDVSEKWAPIAGDKGCIVIDNTSHFRMDPDVPLIIPEVNPEALEGYRNKNIIANPNCSTIQMLVPLKPLHDLAIIKRIVVSTYQSVSGAGKSAMDELWDQTRKMFFNETETQESKNFNKRIAFNVIPQIDKFLDDGSTKEELKMVNETKKILDSTIEVSATCVRVPVFIGHAESVNIEFENNISIDEIRDILGDTDGVSLVDNIETETYITPIECVSDFSVFVSRLRLDHTLPSGINMWVVSDNLRKGAALNSVQIAEELINRKYI